MALIQNCMLVDVICVVSELCVEKNIVCEPCGEGARVAGGYDPATRQVSYHNYQM